MNQQFDPQQSPISIVQGQHLADQMSILIQKIEGLETELLRLNSEPPAAEDDPVQLIINLLGVMVQNQAQHENVLREIKERLDLVLGITEDFAR
jgi:hypothetical protein